MFVIINNILKFVFFLLFFFEFLLMNIYMYVKVN